MFMSSPTRKDCLTLSPTLDEQLQQLHWLRPHQGPVQVADTVVGVCSLNRETPDHRVLLSCTKRSELYQSCRRSGLYKQLRFSLDMSRLKNTKTYIYIYI